MVSNIGLLVIYFESNKNKETFYFIFISILSLPTLACFCVPAQRLIKRLKILDFLFVNKLSNYFWSKPKRRNKSTKNVFHNSITYHNITSFLRKKYISLTPFI